MIYQGWVKAIRVRIIRRRGGLRVWRCGVVLCCLLQIVDDGFG